MEEGDGRRGGGVGRTEGGGRSWREGGEGRKAEDGRGGGGAESMRTDTGVVGRGEGGVFDFCFSPLSGKGGGKAPRTLWIEMD